MKIFILRLAVCGVLAGIATLAPVEGSAAPKKLSENGSCVDKGGRGWGSTTDDARFQAWEAVLQDTDWAMWAAWMAGGAKVGSAASGYKVSNIREKCHTDGSDKVCVMRAKLCK